MPLDDSITKAMTLLDKIVEAIHRLDTIAGIEDEVITSEIGYANEGLTSIGFIVPRGRENPRIAQFGNPEKARKFIDYTFGKLEEYSVKRTGAAPIGESDMAEIRRDMIIDAVFGVNRIRLYMFIDDREYGRQRTEYLALKGFLASNAKRIFDSMRKNVEMPKIENEADIDEALERMEATGKVSRDQIGLSELFDMARTFEKERSLSFEFYRSRNYSTLYDSRVVLDGEEQKTASGISLITDPGDISRIMKSRNS